MTTTEIEDKWRTTVIPFSAKLKQFTDNQWGCPWMRCWAKNGQVDIPQQGIFLMQDWGSENERLTDATCNLKCWLDDSESATIPDQTIQNLLKDTKWNGAFTNGEWLITNAVWGLRTNAKKCSYLGDKIHQAAYINIWKRLVLDAAQKNNSFQLIVAGEWARFKDDPSNGKIELKKYLKKWDELAKVPSTQYKDISDNAHVHFCSHPCTWHWKNFSGGPPKP